MASSGRYTSARGILGAALFEKVQNSRVLVVGAGGIGCELIKNMVMTGFGSGANGRIVIMDLDTIDLSNLNRQFLFQKQHVKRPKAVVARETALKFNPHVNIKALHRSIKDAEFDVEYFETFDFVLNALDNLEARRHVNRMCLAANIPLVESGTSGYVGQVQPIKRDVTECFDCTGKPVPKTFAVCTIRSTPSTAHHCIAWAKSYLFPQLYGADDEADSQQELDDAERNGENVNEIQELRKEAKAIKELRSTLSEPKAAERIFDKIYNQDIVRLVKMEDLWKHRKAPHPLSFEDLDQASSSEAHTSNGLENTEKDANKIKDQRHLSLVDSFQLFVTSVGRLSERINPNEPLSFDKDDDDTLNFVVAAANLRASAFEIETQTRFQVKEYAGNIIPAIATTNAICAGVLVLQALNILRQDWKAAKMVWLSRSQNKIFSVSPLPAPNPYCSVCRVVYLPISFQADFTLGQFIEKVVIGELGLQGHITVQESSRVIWETEDFEDNVEKSLVELGMVQGCFMTVLDDDEPHYPVSFSIAANLASDSHALYQLGAPLPKELPIKQQPPVSEQDGDDSDDDVEHVGGEGTNGKRTADDAGLEEGRLVKKSKAMPEYIVLDDEDGEVTIDLT